MATRVSNIQLLITISRYCDSQHPCKTHFICFCLAKPTILTYCLWSYSPSRRPHAYWYWGFEIRRGHGHFSLVNVVSYTSKASATGRSLAQGSPTESVCETMCVITCNSKHLHPERGGIKKHAYKYKDMGQTRRSFPRYAKMVLRYWNQEDNMGCAKQVTWFYASRQVKGRKR